MLNQNQNQNLQSNTIWMLSSNEVSGHPAQNIDENAKLLLSKDKLILDKVGIDIVHGCQLHCVGCPNSTIRPKIKRMHIETFEKIIRNIDVDHINLLRLFNFGEPLLNDKLPEILESLNNRKWSCGNIEISTNAQYHDFVTLERSIKTRVLNTFSISCDGDGTPESYEKLRTPSKWSKFVEFIEKISALRDKYAPEMLLITRTICTDKESQERWIKLLGPLGFRIEFRDWLYLPESSVNMTGKPVNVPSGVCSFIRPGNRLYIDYDGKVVPCCAHPQAAILGNIANQKFTEILQSDTRANIYQLMKNDRGSMDICNSCPY